MFLGVKTDQGWAGAGLDEPRSSRVRKQGRARRRNAMNKPKSAQKGPH